MEISDVVGANLAFHGIAVGFVVILAVLVFVFGFKTAEEPPFDKLTNSGDDRKPAGKKRKVKDKKSQSNGHATSVANDRSDGGKQKVNENGKTATTPKAGKTGKEERPAATAGKHQEKKQVKSEVGATKAALKENKGSNKVDPKAAKKSEPANKDVKNKNKGKENVGVEERNKRNAARSKRNQEKPADFDEGGWEQAIYRKDKKKNRIVIGDDDVAAATDKAGDKKEIASPGKRKPNKGAATATATATAAVAVTEPTETDADKKPKRDAPKKERANKSGKANEETGEPAEVVAAVEKPDAKSKATNEKKEEADGNAGDKKETPTTAAALVVEEVAKQKVAAANNTLEENIAFDEFADSCPEKWKEPKTSKKSNNRKKVRKDQ